MKACLKRRYPSYYFINTDLEGSIHFYKVKGNSSFFVEGNADCSCSLVLFCGILLLLHSEGLIDLKTIKRLSKYKRDKLTYELNDEINIYAVIKSNKERDLSVNIDIDTKLEYYLAMALITITEEFDIDRRGVIQTIIKSFNAFEVYE